MAAGPALRDLLMAAAAHAAGLRKPKAAETRLAGNRALAVRAHIAHRALWALLMCEMKKAKRRRSG